ncbi:universal stress protein [Vibrio sinaloensis]|uniref:universal stress protein n=1 Tax=Photobacterium sp. (strain ATCC 43367) TaxID=379097 RepID=UPI0020644732|nr:universal stress protein [Vibrio sinaloensis]UPQ89396.1 universal stress protein [Vibrio sinaloensis]
MKRFKNILYVSQGLPSESDSIGQALRLSSANQATLNGLIVSPALPAHMEQYQELYRGSLFQSLEQQISQARQVNDISHADTPFPLHLSCDEHPAVTIIRSVLSQKHDLVIKDAEPVDDDGEGFKAMDMTLLRKCPCPVWLNRPAHQPRNKRRVAVAIDPTSNSEEHHRLSLRLLELARSIADSCDSRLHVVSCWEYQLERYLSNHVWIKIEDQELNRELDKAKQHHRQALDSMIAEANISGNIQVHHLHGVPDDKIPDCVESEDIDVLVMGTLARTGIPGFVIGNTAENILQSVKCSLVALKPDGFVSPIS